MSSGSRILSLCGSIAILLVAVLGYVFAKAAYSPTSLFVAVMGMLFLVAIFIFYKDDCPWLKGQPLKCSTVFLIGYIITHFQVYIDVLLENIHPDDPFFMVDSSLIAKGAFLSLIGLGAFFCGYYVSKGKVIKCKKSPKVVSLGGLLTFTAIMFFVWIGVVGLNRVVYGGYAIEDEQNILLPYVSLIFSMTLWGYIFFHARNFKVRQQRPSLTFYVTSLGWFNIILFAYLTISFAVGGRSISMATACIYFLGYVYSSQVRLSKLKIFIAILGASVFLRFIGEIRTSETGVSIQERIVQVFNSENELPSFSPNTLELAGSIRCLHLALDYVPKYHSFLLGRFQLGYIMSVIPSGSRWSMLLGIMPSEFRYIGSASFVTWVRQGDNPNSGDGTTCVADIYLDFGVVGCIFAFFIWGFWVRRFDVNLYSPFFSPSLLYSFVFVYFGKAIFVSRSSILFELKSVIYLFAVIFVYELLCSKKSIPSN